MSEEEIIKEIENYENWKVVYNPGGLYQFIPLPKDYKQAIQGLLDLYQKEKEKKEKAIKYILKKQSLQYKYALSKIECEELLKLLEERN